MARPRRRLRYPCAAVGAMCHLVSAHDKVQMELLHETLPVERPCQMLPLLVETAGSAALVLRPPHETRGEETRTGQDTLHLEHLDHAMVLRTGMLLQLFLKMVQGAHSRTVVMHLSAPHLLPHLAQAHHQLLAVVTCLGHSSATSLSSSRSGQCKVLDNDIWTCMLDGRTKLERKEGMEKHC